jgi:hypothetical protein
LAAHGFHALTQRLQLALLRGGNAECLAGSTKNLSSLAR